MPPVKIPLSLSSSFGEFRANHFHAGIDIRTNGREGLKVFAVDDGYISRIKISPWSYGNTLYIDHPNGYTSVYAHLKNFSTEIEELTRKLQYQNKKYAIDINIEKGKFNVKKGDFIALSGNSGRSFGPHLHFEIRETKSEFPVDPLRFYPQIQDNIKPVFKNLYVYQYKDENIDDYKKSKYRIYGNNGKYYINQTVETSGHTGFGIESFDYINNSRNKCGIKSISLSIDSSIVYEFFLDKFSYYEKRYINALIDYTDYITNRRKINKLFIEPGNKFSFFKNVINNGIYFFNDNKTHIVECTISDYRNNISKLSFNIKSRLKDTTKTNKAQQTTRKMLFNKENIFINDSIKVIIPDSVLYNNISFEYSVSDKIYGSLTPVYHIHKPTTPLHNNITISIHIDNIPDSLQSKLLIARISKGNRIISYGGKYDKGWLTTETNVFGKYTVLIDTIPPKISSTDIYKGAKFINDNDIIFKISDNLSGIESYNGFIDGEWILFKFFPKKNIIIYNFDELISKTGKKHNLSLEVKDERGNKSIFETFFYY